MPISNFYKTTFTINRNSWTNGATYSNSTETEIGTFLGHLQQASAELVANMNLNFTNTYTIWCSSASNVLVGDRLTSGGSDYSVKAIQDNTSVGANKHLELVVEKQKNES